MIIRFNSRRTRWKADSKFVLKRVGADPSWRARLGNLMIHDQRSSPGSTPASSRKVLRSNLNPEL